MYKSEWTTIKSIVDQVLELPEDERETYIDNQCGDDPELKGEVTKFLDSIYESEGWLEDQKAFREELLNEIVDDISNISIDPVSYTHLTLPTIYSV